MKKGTSLLIGCSLVVAGALFAQQPDEQQTPNKGHKGAEKPHEATSETQQGPAKVNPKNRNHQEKAGAQQQAEQGQTPRKRTDHANNENGEAKPSSSKTEGANANVNAKTGSEANATENASPGAKEARENRRNARNQNAAQKMAPKGTPASSNSEAANIKTNAPAQPPNAAATNNNTTAAGANANAKGRMKRVEPQQLQQIRQQHASFHAQARPDRAPAVTFNANFRIQGAERWQGAQYEAFRSYHPQWHDQGWYHQHYTRVELIGGGYYYWNNGYWYPAWGYNTADQYYAYDGPIYVGHSAEPPDQVIADVQTELQQMGYYQGDVDGLLGPQTQEALAAYQQDQGLMATSVIDEPTLDSLGMES